MKPVMPNAPHAGAQPIVIAANQPQYEPLPAFVDADGVVMTEWELSAEDLAKIVNGGRIRLWIWTFRQPLQPLMIEAVDAAPAEAVADATGHP